MFALYSHSKRFLLLKVRQQKEEGQLLHLALLRFLNLDFFCSFLRMAKTANVVCPCSDSCKEFKVDLTFMLIVCERLKMKLEDIKTSGWEKHLDKKVRANLTLVFLRSLEGFAELTILTQFMSFGLSRLCVNRMSRD